MASQCTAFLPQPADSCVSSGSKCFYWDCFGAFAYFNRVNVTSHWYLSAIFGTCLPSLVLVCHLWYLSAIFGTCLPFFGTCLPFMVLVYQYLYLFVIFGTCLPILALVCYFCYYFFVIFGTCLAFLLPWYTTKNMQVVGVSIVLNVSILLKHINTYYNTNRKKISFLESRCTVFQHIIRLL